MFCLVNASPVLDFDWVWLTAFEKLKRNGHAVEQANQRFAFLSSGVLETASEISVSYSSLDSLIFPEGPCQPVPYSVWSEL